jgi:hypothetical protein
MELRDSTGQLDFSRVTDEVISALDPTRQKALLDLMKCAEVKEAAVLRRNTATRRLHDAIADEQVKQQVHLDASSPIPFSTAEIEASLGRPLTASEMQQAREQHALRVRGHLEDAARQRARDTYNATNH